MPMEKMSDAVFATENRHVGILYTLGYSLVRLPLVNHVFETARCMARKMHRDFRSMAGGS